MKVIFSNALKARMSTLNDAEQQAVLNFAIHVKQHGLRGLVGRNKSSMPTNPRTKKQKHALPMPKNIVYGITISAYHTMWATRAT